MSTTCIPTSGISRWATAAERARALDPGTASATVWPGCPGRPAPASSWGLGTIAAVGRDKPAGHRGYHPGRARDQPPGARPSEECKARSLEIITTAPALPRGGTAAAGAVRAAARRLWRPLATNRRAGRGPGPRALGPWLLAAGWPAPTRVQVGHYKPGGGACRAGLPGPGPRHRALAEPGHLVPRTISLRTKVRPLVAGTCRRPRAPWIRPVQQAAASCTPPTGRTTGPTTSRHAGPRLAAECAAADPAIVAGCRASGCSRLRRRQGRPARVAGEFYVNAIKRQCAAPRPCPRTRPIPEREEVPDRVLGRWREAKLRRRPEAQAAGRPGGPGDGRRVGKSAGAHRACGWPPRVACVVVADRGRRLPRPRVAAEDRGPGQLQAG